MRTRVYRIAIVAVSAIGSAIVLLQNAGDLTNPTVQMTLAIGLLNVIIIAIRQVSDGTTPTLPTTPVQPPAGPGAGG